MASSVGSDVFALLAVLVICLLVLLLLRHYLPLRSTPAYLLVPVFLALALPASIILLVPIDLASSAGEGAGESRGIWLQERVMLVAWRICYWLTFALTWRVQTSEACGAWVILPFLGEYSDSGYREPKDRSIYALRSNGRYQLMMLGTGTLGAVYFFLNSGFRITSLKALVIALAYAWGLILAIYLMGHGLVALPRRLLRNASVSGRLRRLQAHAPKVHDRLTEAIDELDAYESQVVQLRQRKNGISRDSRDWIEELAETSALPESRLTTSSAPRPARSTPPNVLTERYLADLTRKLKRARHKKARFVDEWDRLVQRAQDLQTILDSRASKHLDFGRPSPSTGPLSNVKLLTPYTRYHLHNTLLPCLRYALSALCATASLAVLQSEMTKSVAPRFTLINLTVAPRARVGPANQLAAAAWLLYMCACALLGLAEVKVWGNRALVRRQTYAESAAWYAGQAAKLTVPLAYNFVTCVAPAAHRRTAFYGLLGRPVDLTPLGSGFSRFFPVLVLLPVCATALGWYGRAGRAIGLGGAVMEEDDDGDDADNPEGHGTGGWREGKALIERESHAGGGAAVGLASRAGTARAAPDEQRAPPRSARQPLGARAGADARGDDAQAGFLQDFALRIRNTLETADRPAWLSGLGDGVGRPRWMGGNADAAAAAAASGGVGGALGRWFGGRPSEGRVRL